MIRALFLIFAVSLTAHAFTPELSRVEPRGAQRGTELTIQLLGKRLYEPQELILYHKGITVKSLTKGKDQKSATAVLLIAPDAPLGEHPMRLRCKGGLTYMRTFWIGQFPTVREARTKDQKSDLNNLFTKPQLIDLNVTVQGVADKEDDDYYQVQCKKGQRLSVEVEAMRLGHVMFDPYIAILDQNRFELAVNDDSPLLKRDCAASIIIPEDGPYTIVVRESSYGGSNSCQYRMHVGTFPRPLAIYPPAAKPGEEVQFTFIGDAKGNLQKKIKTPQTSFAAFCESGGLTAPSGNRVHISPLDYLNETEPNEKAHAAIPLTNPPTAPFAFHGVLATEGDRDWFRFAAKKGQSLRIEVLARELRSPLDSVLILRNLKEEKNIENNDDRTPGNPDSRIDFKVPSDGEYAVQIHDKLNRTGPDFVYRIEVREKKPALTVTLPPSDRRDPQKHKMIQIPRGNRLAIAPNVVRANIACDLTFHAPQLPSGVSFQTPTIPRSLNNFPILFEAKADAPIGGGLYRFEIQDPKTKLRGPFTEKIAHLYVNNQGDYQVTHTKRISVAVIEEAPFHLELFAPPVPLVRNGTMTLKITAKRAKDFKNKITVSLPWKPAGIGAPNEVEIPEGKNEATFILNATADAPLNDWQILVTGESATKRGVVRVSSKFVTLKVAEPFVKMSLEMAATNPGKNTNLLAKIEQLQNFSGKARVILHALPHGVTTTEKNITRQSTNLTFPLAVSDEAKKGKHTNLFCQVIIMQNGHPIPHNVGQGGTLRIDPPPPAQKKKTKAPKPEKKEAPKKPLSRLEQLRQSNTK